MTKVAATTTTAQQEEQYSSFGIKREVGQQYETDKSQIW
jgi:hypothetical protein